jgi:hypothetical protein
MVSDGRDSKVVWIGQLEQGVGVLEREKEP